MLYPAELRDLFALDIDISVEIKANEPIQVRFDDDDPDLNTSWYDVRQI